MPAFRLDIRRVENDSLPRGLLSPVWVSMLATVPSSFLRCSVRQLKLNVTFQLFFSLARWHVTLPPRYVVRATDLRISFLGLRVRTASCQRNPRGDQNPHVCEVYCRHTSVHILSKEKSKWRTTAEKINLEPTLPIVYNRVTWPSSVAHPTQTTRQFCHKKGEKNGHPIT